MIKVEYIFRHSLSSLVQALQNFYDDNPNIEVLRTHHGSDVSEGYTPGFYMIIEYIE